MVGIEITMSHTAATGDSGSPSSGRQDVARHVDIDGIDTVEMTAEEYATAVSALTELVLQWERNGAPNKAA